MEFKPYEEYKESEIDYIGQYPIHWDITKLRFIFEERKEKNYGKREKNILSVVKDIGVIPYSEKGNVGNKHSEDIERYKLVYKNDIVMNSMNVIIGSVGRSRYEGVLSPIYYVLKIRDKEKFNVIYYENIFRMTSLQRELTKYGKGILAHRMRISMDLLKNLELPLPPKEEQDKIADFLDYNLAKIDRFVELTERQIELLKEQKEVIINDAVTKGIDKDVVYKDSGIEWIGEIPEHWRKDKTIRIFKRIGSGTTPNSSNLNYYHNGKYNWINSGDLKTKYLYASKNKITDIAVNENPSLRLFSENTIIIAMYGATIGNISILKTESYMNQACCGLSEYENNYIVDYSYFILQSMKQFLLESARGGGQPNISQDIIKQTWLPIPPKKEQEEIVAYIEKEIDKIDRTIDLYKRQIELIKEYRTSLIASAVTGKIDVRDF